MGNETMSMDFAAELSDTEFDGAALAAVVALFAAPVTVGSLAIYLHSRRSRALGEPLLSETEA